MHPLLTQTLSTPDRTATQAAVKPDVEEASTGLPSTKPDAKSISSFTAIFAAKAPVLAAADAPAVKPAETEETIAVAEISELGETEPQTGLPATAIDKPKPKGGDISAQMHGNHQINRLRPADEMLPVLEVQPTRKDTVTQPQAQPQIQDRTGRVTNASGAAGAATEVADIGQQLLKPLPKADIAAASRRILSDDGPSASSLMHAKPRADAPSGPIPQGPTPVGANDHRSGFARVEIPANTTAQTATGRLLLPADSTPDDAKPATNIAQAAQTVAPPMPHMKNDTAALVAQQKIQPTQVLTPERRLAGDRADPELALTPRTDVKSPPPATSPVFSPPVAVQRNKQTALGDSGKSAISMFEAEQSLTTRTDATHTSTTQHVQSTHQTAQLPQYVARQIAEALKHLPNRPVEITLNPEELGRVRLAVSTSDMGIVVNVLAERAETVDLMRRHIASLDAAFQDIGYSDISFSFSGGHQAPEDTDRSTSNDPDVPHASDAQLAAAHQIHLTSGNQSGLDIRI